MRVDILRAIYAKDALPLEVILSIFALPLRCARRMIASMFSSRVTDAADAIFAAAQSFSC